MHRLPERARKMARVYITKAVSNERKYPNIVELAVGGDALDVGLGRRIMHFHNSRHIKLRYGRRILREGKTYYRWCFSDLPTARAFFDQFDGSLHEPNVDAR